MRGRSAWSEVVENHPEDESVFGVRDMTGSVCKSVIGQTNFGHLPLRGSDFKQQRNYMLQSLVVLSSPVYLHRRDHEVKT